MRSSTDTALWSAESSTVTVAARPPASPYHLPAWTKALVAIAVAQTTLSLVLVFSGLSAIATGVSVPAWVYIALSIVFTVCGLGLVASNRNDARAAWLGVLFTLFGTPLAVGLQRYGSPAMKWLGALRPEACAALVFWMFLAAFPSPAQALLRRWIKAAAIVSAIVAVWCLFPIVQTRWVASSFGPPRWAALFFGNRPGDANWLLVMICSLPALPTLWWRARIARGDDQRRIQLFVRGLVIGMAPFTVEVLVEEAWPSYSHLAHSPSLEPVIGSIIFGALGFVPFITGYSVLFDRLLDTRAVLRAALQYALARYTIVLATFVPFAALVLFVIDHRTEPLSALMTGLRPLVLGGTATIGVIALSLRSGWLHRLDRRYFREPYDSQSLLSTLLSDLHAESIEELALRIGDEIERALHAQAHMFVADEASGQLIAVDGRLAPLPIAATLASLARSDTRPMLVDVSGADSPLRRLPKHERQWVLDGGFSVLVAFRRADGVLAGMLALSPKRSGLPYSKEDRQLLAAIASAIGLIVDNLRVRRDEDRAEDPPARECARCTRVSPVDALLCQCGGTLRPAPVPYMLRNVFRLEERIGAGGMGVVYRATDTILRRDVAIKALTRITQHDLARVRREARAMAAINHPNLAIIHSVESWHGLPFLVQEYLAGGTLSNRFANARPAVAQVVDLGTTLADVLAELHAAQIVHCDIKPGNIGFTGQGVVKLLDFGLARVLHGAALGSTAHAGASSSFPGWFGTPHYMSPEAARAERPAPAFDLWALGVVMYELLAGARPFTGVDADAILEAVVSAPLPDLRAQNAAVPEPLASFLNLALAKDAGRRYPTAAAFGDALRRCGR